MIAPRIAFLFVAAAILAGCAIPVRTDPAVEDRVAIRGEMFSPDRIALPPNSEAVVELRETDAAPAPLVAEQRRQLDGRQLQIPFELSVDSSALKSRTRYVFRGAIVSTPGPVRATEPVEIKARAGVVELGSLRLRPVEQIAFGTPYLCGVGIEMWRAHDLGQWLPMYPPFPAAWQMAIRPWHHVSTSPPAIPDGGFSPVRF
jgi:uncharacterized lipoprotein YbaY